MTTFVVVESITPQVSVQFSADQGPQGGQGVTGATGPTGPTGPSVTEDLTPARYAYDLVVNSGGTITRILEGRFVVTGGVTL